ncbi:hypothetical protein ACFFU9_14915 [Mariniflexile ostreae]|uniref:Uncharacterized protein n=1 Tax=Mariniflexile ostreae TaxID=1520892 RepID=A0ABV5FFA2_9FLAO
MSVKASPQAFISHHVKLDFFNDSNLKTDIQNRISDATEINFQKALENIQGDDKEAKGVDLSELTLLAMAYFFECVFPKHAQIKDADYSINSVKGYFDACNHTSYTAIHEIDTTCQKLRDTALFKACYLIIQCAWFFNSDHFGSHQHIEYVNHYAKTRNKLPEKDYRHDLGYLNKKYNDVDESNIKGVYGYAMVNQWYYLILFLVVKELKVSDANFKTSETRFREYNPLVKCSRMLRPLTPFKVVEADIKSAFPSFIDFVINADKGKDVYSNLEKNHNITRTEAKILFNTWCNSGKYKTVEETKDFLLTCGYSVNECDIITTITHSKDFAFIDFMCKYEKQYIDKFLYIHPYLNGTRLHDAILFIDKKTKPFQFVFDEKCVFGYKALNKPIYTTSYGYSRKPMRYAYTSSLPSASNEEYKNLIRKQISTKPKAIGEANGFRFYAHKYEYISADFDMGKHYDYNMFIYQCKMMTSTLCFLNKKPISNKQLFLILNHIRQNSNIIFNVRFLFRELSSQLHVIHDIIYKQRDFELTERLKFRRDLDFLIAYNTAKGIVNKKNRLNSLFYLLENRIAQSDYSFIDFKVRQSEGTDELARCITLRFNELCTGRTRKPKAHTVSEQALYSITYKEGARYLVEPHKFTNTTRLIQRKIKVYEREILKINRFVNNWQIAKQYLFILSEVTGIEITLDLKQNLDTIQKEKTYLSQQITGNEYKTTKRGATVFDKMYLTKPQTEIKANTPTIKDFETSLEHSAFNIDIEEAHFRGDQFFQEYLKFNKLDENQKEVQEIKVKSVIVFPQFDFDA